MEPYANLLNSLRTGFLNQNYESEVKYRPQLLTNNPAEGKKVLTTLQYEFETCEEFNISVAFITSNGLGGFMNTLALLDSKGVKGKILTSQYLNFTEPEALKKLLRFKNIELRISTEGALHSKGYLFRQKGTFNLIIGSSNLTASALSTNKEWNLKISASEESELVHLALQEFAKDFKQSIPVTKEYIEKYAKLWKKKEIVERKALEEMEETVLQSVKPNKMQEEALLNITQLREQGVNKALLISATGTGKTYLSAFDVQRLQPKKFLFVVHRYNIAEKAKKTFSSLLGSSHNMGMYSGSQKELTKDYLFSTVQTISKQENLEKFRPEHFDYIVIDETHRAGAESYKRIMSHFKPKFLLGMTATPERTDGADIFQMFDYNIAYEIRLHRALEEEMLSPFHYYGITDLTINGEEIDDNTEFNKLTAKERVDRIIEKAEFYGCDDGEVRGLIFCSKNEISAKLSEEFNQRRFGDRYYRTVALSGASSEEERKETIRLLESDDPSEKIDYIFSVDIFNEGIDIPRVNQIIMLRPTQSAIIFVQQLGRGLRKLVGKSYLTVIDFIGNYSNNYLVPIALYGDNSYNKDTLRKLITSGSSMIPGVSTVNFDEITKERIFDSINKANMSKLADLKKDYLNLKYKLGRIPKMVDFLDYGSRDPWLYASYKKSYLNFVNIVEDTYLGKLSKAELELLELFSLEINNSKRIEESIILRELIKHGRTSVDSVKVIIERTFGYDVTDETIDSCMDNLNFEFVRKPKTIVQFYNSYLVPGNDLSIALENPVFRDFLEDNIEFAVRTYSKKFDLNRFNKGLLRYQKYGRKDVCRILNWDNDVSSTVYGYRTNKKRTPCFITYHKSDDISDSTKYNDHFIDQQTFAWESRSNRRLTSDEIQNVINSERILLFVKKEDGEGTDFYYIGDVTILPGGVEQSEMPETGQPVVHFKYRIDEPVEENLYNYLVG